MLFLVEAGFWLFSVSVKLCENTDNSSLYVNHLLDL